MSVRRNRRSTLALLLLLALCVGGFAVCYSAEEDTFAGEATATETTPANRPSPFYDEEVAGTPGSEARAERSPLPRVKIFSKPVKSPPRPTTEESLEPASQAQVPSKTPLPKAVAPEVGVSMDTTSPSPASGRSSYSSGVIWAMGILTAGVIIRQFLKAGGPLSNGSPTAVEVLSRQSLGPQQQLAVVRFGQRVLLVGTTSTGMSTLAQVDDPAEVQALIAELQSSVNSRGASALNYLRSKRPSPYSRSDRTRRTSTDHNSAPVSVSLSTESRASTHERRVPAPPDQEVNDV